VGALIVDKLPSNFQGDGDVFTILVRLLVPQSAKLLDEGI
jgi:hypothetical protein